jgi:adenylate cyclase
MASDPVPLSSLSEAQPEASPVERRLAAILAADVDGYSRLMHADEEGTLETLTAHRAIVDELIVGANGVIFGTAGDSVLAEFPSVVEALHSAIAIQQALQRTNGALPEGRRMHLRIGINVGDVLAKDGDIFGDGVNIAARLEALAEPGGICVSRAARDQLRDRVAVKFDDLGEHSVKNIARPVRVFRVVFDKNAEPKLPDSIGRKESEAPVVEEEPPASDSTEITFWQSVQASDDEAEYRIYLERYPDGAFVDLARARVKGSSGIEDPNVELAFWDTVRGSRDPAMIRAYLEKYPAGEFRSLAEIMLADSPKAGR